MTARSGILARIEIYSGERYNLTSVSLVLQEAFNETHSKKLK